ncbi:MAG: hypothetical protein GEU86_21145 [Actinophytocola sp.]|nr:hypothetical protein [Actinophytocola sp.]
MITTDTDLASGLDNTATALKTATRRAELVAEWGHLDDRVDPDVVLDRLSDMSLKTVRLLAAAEKAHTRSAGHPRVLDGRERITYELLHTASAAAIQFHATLATVVDEHRTLP